MSVTLSVVLHDADPHSRTDLTSGLNMLWFVLVLIYLAFHTFPSALKAPLAFRILSLTSPSFHPLLSTLLSKYV